jgi:hypothetical protein
MKADLEDLPGVKNQDEHHGDRQGIIQMNRTPEK